MPPINGHLQPNGGQGAEEGGRREQGADPKQIHPVGILRGVAFPPSQTAPTLLFPWQGVFSLCSALAGFPVWDVARG